MKTTYTITMACAALTTAVAVFGQEPARDAGVQRKNSESKWRAQVGWVHQWDRGMTVSGPDRTLSITEIDGRSLRSSTPGLTYPDNNATGGRTFDDGYVLPDYWTGDAELLDGTHPERYNTTWNWGVDEAGQYNYDGGNHPTLTFHIDNDEAVMEGDATMTGSSAKQESDLPVDGVELKLNRLLHEWVKDNDRTGDEPSDAALKMDLILRLALFSMKEQDFQRSSADQRVVSVRETYTYNDYYGGSDAVGGPFPPLVVPYSGSYGTGTDAGPLVPVSPESSRRISRLMGTMRNNVAIRSEIWHLRGAAGLEFAKPLNKRLSLFVSPQLVLEVVNMDVERTESITYTSSDSGQTSTEAARVDRESKTTVVPGLLLSAGVDYRFAGNWLLSAGLGWEWLTEDPSVRVGPNRVRFDLEGGELNLALGLMF